MHIFVCKVEDELAKPSYQSSGKGGRSLEPGTVVPSTAQVGELSWTEKTGNQCLYE